MSNPHKPKLVVGIDFGTTYSGVSWVIEGPNRKVCTINNWPNPLSNIANSEKVPSVISYEGGNVKHWGYEVGPKEEACRWTKILLEKKATVTSDAWAEYREYPLVQYTHQLLKRLQKTPEQVVADFLKAIWDFAKEQIRKREPRWDTDYCLQVVLTVPAVWSDAAKHKTMEAAEKAQLGSAILRVSEPEAAALAVLRAKGEQGALKPGDTFVVCDAGGGTVDLISYNVISTNPLRMEECVEGDGGLCGSAFINFAFERHLTTLFGEEQWLSIKSRHRDELMRTFEGRVKPHYLGGLDDHQYMDFWAADNTAAGLVDNELCVRGSAMKTLFETVFSEVSELVRKQTSTIKATGRQVKAILLVGGFAQSKYLFNELEGSYSAQGIPIIWAEDGISSICRGAAMWGLENSAVDTRVIRRSYGFLCSEEWDPLVHDPRLDSWYFDAVANKKRARNRMSWAVCKGSRVSGTGRHVDKVFFFPLQGITEDECESCSLTVLLMYSESDVAPTRYDSSVSKLCEVTFSVPAWQMYQLGQWCFESGKPYVRLSYTMRVHIAASGLGFSAVLPNGIAVASSSISFAAGE